MRLRVLALAAPLIGLLECGPVILPKGAEKANTCSIVTDGDVSSPCESYCATKELCEPPSGKPLCTLTTYGENACLQEPAALPPSIVLVVDVPIGARYAAGQT